MNYATRMLCLLVIGTAVCPVWAQNLVPNPSFEQHDTCPYTIGFQEGDRPQDWFSWFNSPEYFNACAGSLMDIDTLVDVPRNGWTYQQAWEGDAYIGLRTYDGGNDYRELAGATLLSPLITGCTYQLRFRANAAYNGTYWLPNGGGAANNLGMLFTMASNAWSTVTGPEFGFRHFAHLRTETVITDTLGWTLVEGTFTADSAYSHIVLGNFYPDSSTVGFPNGNSSTYITYYVIDGVEVIPLAGDCANDVDEIQEGNAPRVEWGMSRVVVHSDDLPISACISDATGRVIVAWMAGVGRLELPRPRSPGIYSLSMMRSERYFVKMFLISE